MSLVVQKKSIKLSRARLRNLHNTLISHEKEQKCKQAEMEMYVQLSKTQQLKALYTGNKKMKCKKLKHYTGLSKQGPSAYSSHLKINHTRK
jgi:hypothetical protein